jgi:hypothetical protein
VRTADRLPLASNSWHPGELPAEWEQWPSTVQGTFLLQREPGQWHLIFKGVATYNGYGDPIDTSRAEQIARAFQPPLTFAQVHTAGFYDDAGFCPDCNAPYCYQHWHVCPSLATAAAPAATVRAWTRIGNSRRGSAATLKYSSDGASYAVMGTVMHDREEGE